MDTMDSNIEVLHKDFNYLIVKIPVPIEGQISAEVEVDLQQPRQKLPGARSNKAVGSIQNNTRLFKSL